MARVYGRVHIKDSDEPLDGEIRFEPRELAVIRNGVLIAKNSAGMHVTLNKGKFSVDLAPDEYYVYLSNHRMEIEVPMVNEITLKELLQVRYEQ